LWLRRFGKDETEFVIAAIPLGGYVKMLDENEGEVAREDLPRAFNRQSLGVRAAIVVAGPLLNFLFAIVAYTVMYMVGVTGMKALVGEVTPQSLAEQAGFQPGYQIVAINEQPAARWDSVIQATLLQMLDNQKELIFSVQNQQGHQYDLTLKLDGFTINDIAEGHFFDKLGIRPFRPSIPAVISSIMPDSAAERAGLRAGDKIIALDNQPIKDWKAWADYVSAHPDERADGDKIYRSS